MYAVSGLVSAVLINAMATAAMIFLISVGLTLIYGVVKILNVAHGSFYGIGALTASSVYIGLNTVGANQYLLFPAMLMLALVLGVAVGPAVERVMFRWTMRSSGNEAETATTQLLATYAVFLMLEDVQLLIWGTRAYSMGSTLSTFGIVHLLGNVYTGYSLALIPLALVVCFGLDLFLRQTWRGRVIRAVAADQDMAACLGISVGRAFGIAFALGTGLALLAGAVNAANTAVSPGIGTHAIILSFAVIALAGMGSIWGALVASVLVGVGHAACVFFAPYVTPMVPYLLMVAILVVRPNGLFAGPVTRAI